MRRRILSVCIKAQLCFAISLPFYAILRSIPNKLGGVLCMGAAMVVLLFLPYLDLSKVRGPQFRPIFKPFYWFFIVTVMLLGWLGACPVEEENILKLHCILLEVLSMRFINSTSILFILQLYEGVIYKDLLWLIVVRRASCFNNQLYCFKSNLGVFLKIFTRLKNAYPFFKFLLCINLIEIPKKRSNVIYFTLKRAHCKYKLVTFFQRNYFKSTVCWKQKVCLDFFAKKWIKNNQKLNLKLWTLYCDPKKRAKIFSKINLKIILSHIQTFGFILSRRPCFFSKSVKFTKHKLPADILFLQTTFAKSFCSLVYAIYLVLRSKLNSKRRSLPFLSVHSFSAIFNARLLKSTPFYHSKKHRYFKKDLPFKAMLTIKGLLQLRRYARQYNKVMCLLLLKQSNFTHVSTQYKYSLRQFTLFKKESSGIRLKLPSVLVDKVWYFILKVLMYPMVEATNLKSSYSIKPICLKKNLVYFIYKRLHFMGSNSAFKKGYMRNYARHWNLCLTKGYADKGLMGIRKSCVSFTQNKYKSLKYYRNQFVLKFSLFKLIFKSAALSKLHKHIPLSSKLIFFITFWLYRYILNNVVAKIEKNSFYLNFFWNLSTKGLYSCLHSFFHPKGILTKPVVSKFWCFKHINSVLLFGKFNWLQTDRLRVKIYQFFLNKGIIPVVKPVIKFWNVVEKTSITFLGFAFLFNLRYKLQPSSWGILKQKHLKRDLVTLVIAKNSINCIKQCIKTIFHKKNSGLPITLLTFAVNSFLKGVIRYFAIAQTIKVQFRTLDLFYYKLLRKFLFFKHKSMSKVRTKVYKLFYKTNTFIFNQFKTLKTYQV